MRLSGRPIRCTLIPSTVLLAAVVMGWSVPAVCASWNQPLHEKKHAAKQQIEALEEQWRQAQLEGDVATMDKLLSDDYIGISMTGQVNTKNQQLDRMRMHKIALTRLDLGDRQVKLIGSIAIVTSRAEVEEPTKALRSKGRTATHGSISVSHQGYGRSRALRPRGCRGREIRTIREIKIASPRHKLPPMRRSRRGPRKLRNTETPERRFASSIFNLNKKRPCSVGKV